MCQKVYQKLLGIPTWLLLYIFDKHTIFCFIEVRFVSEMEMVMNMTEKYVYAIVKIVMFTVFCYQLLNWQANYFSFEVMNAVVQIGYASLCAMLFGCVSLMVLAPLAAFCETIMVYDLRSHFWRQRVACRANYIFDQPYWLPDAVTLRMGYYT